MVRNSPWGGRMSHSMCFVKFSTSTSNALRKIYEDGKKRRRQKITVRIKEIDENAFPYNCSMEKTVYLYIKFRYAFLTRVLSYSNLFTAFSMCMYFKVCNSRAHSSSSITFDFWKVKEFLSVTLFLFLFFLFLFAFSSLCFCT